MVFTSENTLAAADPDDKVIVREQLYGHELHSQRTLFLPRRRAIIRQVEFIFREV